MEIDDKDMSWNRFLTGPITRRNRNPDELSRGNNESYEYSLPRSCYCFFCSTRLHSYFESSPCRDVLSHFLQLLSLVWMFSFAHFSLMKCLAQSQALVCQCSLIENASETCGSSDRNHSRCLETSWLRAPETFFKWGSACEQEKIKQVLHPKKIILLPDHP